MAGHPKTNLAVVLNNCEKSTMQHLIGKPNSLNFVNLPSIFCSRLLLAYLNTDVTDECCV